MAQVELQHGTYNTTTWLPTKPIKPKVGMHISLKGDYRIWKIIKIYTIKERQNIYTEWDNNYRR